MPRGEATAAAMEDRQREADRAHNEQQALREMSLKPEVEEKGRDSLYLSELSREKEKPLFAIRVSLDAMPHTPASAACHCRAAVCPPPCQQMP